MLSKLATRRAAAAVFTSRQAIATRRSLNLARSVRAKTVQDVRFKSSRAAGALDPGAVDPVNQEILTAVDPVPVEPKKEVDPGSLDNFDMCDQLKANLRVMGVNNLFPVQIETYNGVRSGQDMIVRSKTGSGKTMAFALPTLDKLFADKEAGVHRRKGQPAALVLAPTRELASQVKREFEKLGPQLGCVAVYGGAPIMPQMRELSKNVDVLIATPGRLIDLIERGEVDLSRVSVAILDEADEMLKMGFTEAIETIYAELPPKDERQNLLFSATVSKEIQRIARGFLNNGRLVDLVGEDSDKIPAGIEMIAMSVRPTQAQKSAALANILEQYCSGDSGARALVFTSTKAMCDTLSTSGIVLETGVKCLAMHGDLQQSSREIALAAFREGRAKCLIATDVAARGLDIPKVDLVVHYDLPTDFDSFVHRTGRTGRAGRAGVNIVLFKNAMDKEIGNLERFTGAKFKRMAVPASKSLTKNREEKVVQSLGEVSNRDIDRFVSVASSILENSDDAEKERALATALALIAGSRKATDFSALSGRSEMQSMVIEGSFEPRNTRRMAGDIVWEMMQLFDRAGGADKFGLKSNQIRENALDTFHPSKCGEKVVFDVSPKLADAILSAQEEVGTNTFSALATEPLPELCDRHRANYVRNEGYGEKGRGPRGGGRGGFNTRGGRGGSRGGYGGRDNRGGYGGRDNGGYGGRDNGGYGGRDNGGYGGRDNGGYGGRTAGNRRGGRGRRDDFDFDF
mmetsp:Transcript_9230/g.17430  ORF Transcript_9230/g.17430 Transcript_9230/m.17430 type:complete len:743 (+) Transcript_9230:232-2460(+)|eukprot:CAMPEP_0203748164 /NCGR_PEP_ID=MMETSP0098-20131031/3109_1 /ASSEMBLY_ACC=CAM_ASM_000208 /TAXON_ID=96639 /ORGANISM=" , Strain NY0313808BC1" /LENGTH=742 /DNA_ID=CAMNT_0050636803 /DNA_START=224 /DNA_END=2452 /DNA_ORIENTATION=-